MVIRSCYNFNMSYRVISLFSGCGGLDLGLLGGFSFLGRKYHKNPFKIVWANDINERAAKTWQLNFPHSNIICGDITKLLGIDDNENSTLSLLEDKLTFPKADVVTGGFPCQDFSLAGKRGGLNVKRGKLYQSMAKVIELTRPKVFLAENVKGLLSWQNGLAIKTITDDLTNLGYHVEHRLLNTADYGVPQTRERVIIIGIRHDINASLL